MTSKKNTGKGSSASAAPELSASAIALGAAVKPIVELCPGVLKPAQAAAAVVETVGADGDIGGCIRALLADGVEVSQPLAEAIAAAIESSKAKKAKSEAFVAKLVPPEKKVDKKGKEYEMPAMVECSGGTYSYRAKWLSPRLILSVLDNADEARRVALEALNY